MSQPFKIPLAVLLWLFLVSVGVGDVRGVEPQIHKGTVVSATNGQLVLKEPATGREQTHLVSRETKITINGRVGRLEDLKMSTWVRVTTDGGSKVVSIATVDDDKHFVAAN